MSSQLKAATLPWELPGETEPWNELITDQRSLLDHLEMESGVADSSHAPRLIEPRPRSGSLLTPLSLGFDYLRGLWFFRRIGPCVTVFGSARIRPDEPAYQLARRMGGEIVKLGFTVMTGGGPGIMEAANRGAREAGGRSVGCNIKLAFEQRPNAYLHRCVTLSSFSVRKLLLRTYSYAFVVFPGGSGTLDDLFEALTLIQTGKLEPFPIVLMGTEYWLHLTSLIESMASAGTIGPRDRALIRVTDSVEETLGCLRRNAIEPFGLHLAGRRKWRRHVRPNPASPPCCRLANRSGCK